MAQVQAQFKLRMSEYLRSELDRAAERKGRSVNNEIVMRLLQSFDDDENKIDAKTFRGDLSRVAVRLIKVIRDIDDKPELKALSHELMEIFTEVGAALAFTFPPSDESWRQTQERLSYILERDQKAKEDAQ